MRIKSYKTIIFTVSLLLMFGVMLSGAIYIDKRDGTLDQPFLVKITKLVKTLQEGDFALIKQVAYGNTAYFLDVYIIKNLYQLMPDYFDQYINLLSRRVNGLSISDNIKNIEFPIRSANIWGIDFAPIKDVEHALITEKNYANLIVMEKDKYIKRIPIKILGREIVTPPNYTDLGFVKKTTAQVYTQSGLNDITFDSKYDNLQNQYIYFSVLLKRQIQDKICASRALVRVRYDYKKRVILDVPITQKNIIFEPGEADMLAFCNRTGSAGSRIFFLKDDTILYSSGAPSAETYSEKKERISIISGQMLRLTRDGQAVCNIKGKQSNPFCHQEGASPYVYSFGHKNAQGIAQDLAGDIYVSEHGQKRGDEINLIRKAQDYGHPFICVQCTPYSMSTPVSYERYHKDSTLLHKVLASIGYKNPEAFVAGLTPPLYAWQDYPRKESIAPSGLAYYGYQDNYYNSLFVATLANTKLEWLKIKDDGSIARQPPLLGGKRFRDVIVRGPKTLYVLIARGAGEYRERDKMNLLKITLK